METARDNIPHISQYVHKRWEEPPDADKLENINEAFIYVVNRYIRAASWISRAKKEKTLSPLAAQNSIMILLTEDVAEECVRQGIKCLMGFDFGEGDERKCKPPLLTRTFEAWLRSQTDESMKTSQRFLVFVSGVLQVVIDNLIQQIISTPNVSKDELLRKLIL